MTIPTDAKAADKSLKSILREQLVESLCIERGLSPEQAEKEVRVWELNTIFNYRPFVD